MATLILPCAGKSTRFKNTRPKWSLTHPYGELMLIQGIKGLELDKYEKIIHAIKKHELIYIIFCYNNKKMILNKIEVQIVKIHFYYYKLLFLLTRRI